MEIKVVHEIRFSKEAEGLATLVAQALTGAVAKKETAKPVEAPVRNEEVFGGIENPVADSTVHFFNEKDGNLLIVKKGEPIGFTQHGDYTFITKAQYDAMQAQESEDDTQAEKSKNVATKTMYFQHEGSGDLVVVEKGESLDFLDGDIFDELTIAQYNNLKLDAEKAAQEAEKSEPAPGEEPQTEDEPSHDLKVEDLRVIASKFVGAGKQKELKVLFGEFNDAEGKKAIKLSGIQVKDYPTFMDRAKEVLKELGVE